MGEKSEPPGLRQWPARRHHGPPRPHCPRPGHLRRPAGSRRRAAASAAGSSGATSRPVSCFWVARQYGRPPDPRWPGYVEAARIVRQGGGSVAAVEIGFLGYFSEAHVLDLMGLVSPEALAARQRGDLADLVARERPEWLLDVTLFRAQVLDQVMADPRIAAAYKEVAELRDERHPGIRIRVLRR